MSGVGSGFVSKSAPWLCLVALGALAVMGGLYYTELRALTEEKGTTAGLRGELEALQKSFAELSQERKELSEALYSEQQKNAQLAEEIEGLEDEVGVLNKLARTDPELLQKYSKVYFLNEHYAPETLREIPQEYVWNNTEKTQQINKKVFPYLKNLLTDAKEDNVELLVISAFRSFGEQEALKTGYTLSYGSGASKFSADQGYSEHQLGTTVDFTVKALGANFEAFAKSDGYAWLTKNAYRYGFVLSYPENNSYYQFEPWHWRFVGKDLARKLFREKKHFYDLDQRDIDAFLVNLFG